MVEILSGQVKGDCGSSLGCDRAGTAREQRALVSATLLLGVCSTCSPSDSCLCLPFAEV